MGKVRVLMVCTANICRSPMAEGMLGYRLQESNLQRKIQVDSAGTRASQPGHKPDVRAQKVMAEAGVNLGRIKARKVTLKDMVRSDYIVAMDSSNYNDLVKICPPEHRSKIKLLMSFAPSLGLEEVPDPYYGSYKGFEEIFRLIDTAVIGLQHYMESQHE
jgi:protein-tyrosine phosphatase